MKQLPSEGMEETGGRAQSPREPLALLGGARQDPGALSAGGAALLLRACALVGGGLLFGFLPGDGNSGSWGLGLYFPWQIVEKPKIKMQNLGSSCRFLGELPLRGLAGRPSRLRCSSRASAAVGMGRVLTLLSVCAGVSGCDFPLSRAGNPVFLLGQRMPKKQRAGEQPLVQQSQSSARGCAGSEQLQAWVSNGPLGQEGIIPFLQKGRAAASATQGLEVGFPKASWLRRLGLASRISYSRAPVQNFWLQQNIGLGSYNNAEHPGSSGEQQGTVTITNPLRHRLSEHHFFLPDFHLARLCPFSSFPDVCLGAELGRGEAAPAGRGALGVISKCLKTKFG